ncbi:hypothetical protein MOX02_28050 [Methylobacterium oxalidis]|uniref:Uncharacterized protein n=1 Tax=Methylobacterium oxalidis TaxID=944322 RepID=A0A512J435_9HYPH|nr:hypothetical protein MOX02_28050 [Methylobacterium oxalidis]GLS63593.1 hypothetical protein GCM10007888_19740 [Methylobacterium oxalidis]
MGWDPGYEGAVVELGADEIVLRLDAREAVADRQEVELSADLAPARLETESAREGAKARRHRHGLQFEPPLRLAVLEGRPHAVGPALGQAALVVPVDPAARPEADHLEGPLGRPVLAAPGA